METLQITCELYKKRIADLCLRSGMNDFPTKHRDQLVLLKSIAVAFEGGKNYTEGEVNLIIKGWLERMSEFFAWDHFMLRRRLVDEGFLTRHQDGSCYGAHPEGPAGVVFDSEIGQLDILDIIDEARELIAQRKAEYLQKQAN